MSVSDTNTYSVSDTNNSVDMGTVVSGTVSDAIVCSRVYDHSQYARW